MQHFLATLFILILLLLTGCTPQRIASYPNEFSTTNANSTYWNALLLLPDEYPVDTVVKPIHTRPFIYDFQKNHPGFVDMARFRQAQPQHPLAQLRRWYYASFFTLDKSLYYMVMEFHSPQQAKEYLSHLRSSNPEDAVKILRYKHLIISMQVRDRLNELLSKDAAAEFYTWIEEKQSKIMSEL